MRRVAIVGAGISGLAAAHHLADEAQVTLYEAAPRLGGHAHTVDVTLDGVTHGVDTGFLVFNHRTYPHLTRLFDELGVDTAPAEMSFSVQAPRLGARSAGRQPGPRRVGGEELGRGAPFPEGLEWSGRDLDSVFAQRSNLLRPRFLRMLAQIVRFNRLCTAIAERGSDAELDEPLGHFLDREGFGDAFRHGYFLPMVACIWSCPAEQMLQFPVGTLIRFCHNHGLIALGDRPQWHTVRGGSRNYVRRLAARVADVRTGTPVREVRRLPPGDGRAGVLVATDHGHERFDDVILACHSDQALTLLADAGPAEREVLGAIRYHANRTVLHTDASLLPRRRRAWAAWNYARTVDPDSERGAVCLHYLINRLQPLPWQRPVLVTLNPDPARPPRPDAVLAQSIVHHPLFDRAAVAAQARLPSIQGHSRVWYCGAWTRYGFHEDGLVSALDVVRQLRARRQALPLAA